MSLDDLSAPQGPARPASRSRIRRCVDAVWRVGLRAAYRLLRIDWWLRRPVVHGAFVAVWSNRKLLLIRNSYRSGETIPCGFIQRGESPRQAAVRELWEEVGISVPPGRLVEAGEWVVEWESKEDHAHIFELELPAPPPITIDHREVVWAGFCERAELDSRPLVPHVTQYLADRRARPPGPDDLD